MIKDKYRTLPNLRFPVCYIKQPLITLWDCCCFWRNRGGARSLSPQIHAFYTLLSTSNASVLKLLLSLALCVQESSWLSKFCWMEECIWGISEAHFWSNSWVCAWRTEKSQVSGCFALLSPCFVVCRNCSTYSAAPNLTCHNDSHVHKWKEVSQA